MLLLNSFFGLAMVGAEGPPLGGRLKPRTARPPKGGGPQKNVKTSLKPLETKPKL